MPFEEPTNQQSVTPDRRLGDEWTDWDGTTQRNDTRTPIVVFVLLATVAVAWYGALGWGILWLVSPRLSALGAAWTLQWLAWGWTGYLGLWLLTFWFGLGGIKLFKQLMRVLGSMRWVLGTAVVLGKLIGFSRDQIAHAFILTYNRFEVLPPLIKDPQRLLLLVPRCLNRETMQALRRLKDAYNISFVVALGGTEARKAIAQIRPKGIVAVACERDLMVGIKDLRGRIPVLSFSNQRPEGPCKNTVIDAPAVEKSIKLFLGKA